MSGGQFGLKLAHRDKPGKFVSGRRASPRLSSSLPRPRATPSLARGHMADTWGTLRPSDSAHRRCTQLDGLWAFIADHKDDGHASGFCSGLPESGRTPIAVPASWNEQLPELDSFLGPAWYERTVWAPLGLTPRQRVFLRFGSVNYSCEVYFNGERAGAHEGGHLPFEVDVTCLLRSSGEPNLLVLRVGDR